MKKSKEPIGKRRNFPLRPLEETLPVAQKITDEMGGKPFKRLLLADALGIKPSSSNYRDLLSSSYKYGLTDGTEKASEILLTDLGSQVTQTTSPSARMQALRTAAMRPEVFQFFYKAYRDKKLPSVEMFPKILASEYDVPSEHAAECAKMIQENGRFAQLIRDIGGSPHVLLDAEPAFQESQDDPPIKKIEWQEQPDIVPKPPSELNPPNEQSSEGGQHSKPIFLGHGKNKSPLQKLQALLTAFQIPHKVTIEEANLGRPISQKVKETMLQCGSAILIFTRDEKFYDENGQEIWRPSENVVHELGAASFAYGDRIMVFKEKGLHFPTNYQNIGYIEFEPDNLESKTTELLKELIGFGLVKITPA